MTARHKLGAKALLATLSIMFSLLIVAPIANAQWISHVSGPDVFGRTKVSAIDVGGSYGLVIKCDSTGKISVNFLIPFKGGDAVNQVSVALLLQVDTGTPIKFSGTSGPWNDDYAAISADGPTKKISQLINEIRVSKHKIDVGLSVKNHQSSAEISIIGSTKAMDAVAKNCKISDLKTM